MTATTARVPRRSAQINLRITLEEDAILTQLAETAFRGSRSEAVSHLIAVHAGKEIERAEQEAELRGAVVPFEVTRWKTPKLSTELIAYVAGLVRAGNLVDTACDLAGVSAKQRSSWLKQGRNDQREGKTSLQADFVAAVNRADAENEVERVALIERAGLSQWRALGYLLERQKPDRYAERKRIDGKVQHSLMPLIDYDRLTASETRTLVELLRKASPEGDDPSVSRASRPAIELVPEDVLDVVDGEWTEAPALEGEALALKPAAPAAEAPGLDADSAEAPVLEARALVDDAGAGQGSARAPAATAGPLEDPAGSRGADVARVDDTPTV